MTIDTINDLDDFIEFGKKAFGVELTIKKSDNPDTYEKLFETSKNDIRYNRVKDELEPTTKNCESCEYYGSHHDVCNYCYKCSLWRKQ